MFTVGCGSAEKLPFTYRYISVTEVEVRLACETLLRQHEQGPECLPFAYQFEADGDLDITMNGRTYELESPYDRDSKVKKKITTEKKIRRVRSGKIAEF